MRKILKYPIEIESGDQSIEVPGKPEVRHIALQKDRLHAWIEVELDGPPAAIALRVYGTGEEIDDGYFWRGSVLDRMFVWHVYERGL